MRCMRHMMSDVSSPIKSTSSVLNLLDRYPSSGQQAHTLYRSALGPAWGLMASIFERLATEGTRRVLGGWAFSCGL